EVIRHYTRSAAPRTRVMEGGGVCPALSLYATIHPTSGDLCAPGRRRRRVHLRGPRRACPDRRTAAWSEEQPRPAGPGRAIQRRGPRPPDRFLTSAGRGGLVSVRGGVLDARAVVCGNCAGHAYGVGLPWPRPLGPAVGVLDTGAVEPGSAAVRSRHGAHD